MLSVVAPRFHRAFDDLRQEVEFGPRGVLGAELHIGAEVAGALYTLDGSGQDVLAGHLQFELAVDRTRRQEEVDARFWRVLHRVGGPVDVGGIAARQPADDGPVDLPGDLGDALEVPRRCDWKPGFDDVDAEVLEGVGHLELFGERHAATGALLAVAQGGVEDDDAVRVGRGHGSTRKGNEKSPGTLPSSGACIDSVATAIRRGTRERSG